MTGSGAGVAGVARAGRSCPFGSEDAMLAASLTAAAAGARSGLHLRHGDTYDEIRAFHVAR